MTINVFAQYSPRATAPDTNYPNGSFKNETSPGANDGTPLDVDTINDILGATEAILTEAGLTVSGQIDTVILSQKLEAIKKISKNYGGFGFTLSEVIADETLKITQAFRISDRGGAWFDVVLATSVTPNTFNIVQCVGAPTLAIVLRDDGDVKVIEVGAICDGVANDTLAIQQSIDEFGYASVSSTDICLVTISTLDYTKLRGDGQLKVGVDLFPAGDIAIDGIVLKVPEIFEYKDMFDNYLASRRVLKPLSITIAAGTHNIDMTSGPNIRHDHPDGQMFTMTGASAATTKLLFDFTGRSAERIYAIGLNGNYNFNFIDGITFDGNNFSGHAEGGPTLGPGNANDPIGCKVQNGGAIEFGTDIIFQFMARNGILVNEGGYCLAVGVSINNCGSDAFVSSLGSALLASNSSCDSIWGDGYFSNRGGELLCSSVVINNIFKRFDDTAGDGIVSVEGGKIYCDNATLDNIADEGIFVGTGSVLSGNGIDIGSSGTGCTGASVVVERGGVMIANNLTVENGLADGVMVIEGGELFAIGLIVKTVTGIGLFIDQGGKVVTPDATIGGSGIGTGSHGVQVIGGELNSVRLDVSHSGGDNIRIEQGSTLVANGLSTIFASGIGLLVTSASLARCSTSIFSDNGSDGINCDNSRITASSATEIDRNGGWGIISRFSGVVNSSGTTIGAANSSGPASPTADVTTGITDSFIYV